MSKIWVGLILMVTGGGIYVFNTESHTTKITFGRLGLETGEVETVAIILGLGAFLICWGAMQWLDRPDTEGEGEE